MCIKFVKYWDKYTEMHGQRNVKICFGLLYLFIHIVTHVTLDRTIFGFGTIA